MVPQPSIRYPKQLESLSNPNPNSEFYRNRRSRKLFRSLRTKTRTIGVRRGRVDKIHTLTKTVGTTGKTASLPCPGRPGSTSSSRCLCRGTLVGPDEVPSVLVGLRTSRGSNGMGVMSYTSFWGSDVGVETSGRESHDRIRVRTGATQGPVKRV